MTDQREPPLTEQFEHRADQVRAARTGGRDRKSDTLWGKLLTPEVVIPLIGAAFTVGMYYTKVDDRIGAVEQTQSEMKTDVKHISHVVEKMAAKMGLGD